MITGFSGYDGFPVISGTKSPEVQLIQQAIVPLGDQMTAAGRDYIQANRFYLVTADYLDKDQMKRMGMGAAAGLVLGGLIGFMLGR